MLPSHVVELLTTDNHVVYGQCGMPENSTLRQGTVSQSWQYTVILTLWIGPAVLHHNNARSAECAGEALEEFESALSRVGDGRPNVTDEAVKEFIREADIYEAEFVMPVSAAELAEQQEAAAAAAAAAAEAAAANGDAEGAEQQAEAQPEPLKPPTGGSKSKGKKPPPSNKKGSKALGGKKGKKGAAEEAADDDLANPDASALRGPLVTLFSGATRVRKKHAGSRAGAVKSEAGSGGGGAAAGFKRETSEGVGDADGGDADGAGGSPSKDEDIAKMVSPLEELDDSGGLPETHM